MWFQCLLIWIIPSSENPASSSVKLLWTPSSIILLQSPGFTINWSKVFQPNQSLCFLGVEMDAVNRALLLPRDRVSELLDILNLTLTKRKCQKHHLQHLVRNLSWATWVARGGWTFLRRLITVMNSAKHPHHHVYLNTQARADLQWWAFFLPVFNCRYLFPDELPLTSALAYTDASPAGGGCCWHNDWLNVNWALDFSKYLPSAYQLQRNLHDSPGNQTVGFILVRTKGCSQVR